MTILCKKETKVLLNYIICNNKINLYLLVDYNETARVIVIREDLLNALRYS